MPSGGGTLLFVITSTPSIKAELLGAKLLAVSNGIAVDSAIPMTTQVEEQQIALQELPNEPTLLDIGAQC